MSARADGDLFEQYFTTPTSLEAGAAAAGSVLAAASSNSRAVVADTWLATLGTEPRVKQPKGKGSGSPAVDATAGKGTSKKAKARAKAAAAKKAKGTKGSKDSAPNGGKR